MEPAYCCSIELRSPFDEVVGRVAEALSKEGFRVLMDIDLQAVLKEKLAVDKRRYRILGACNPSLAYTALRAHPDIGVLLPCNVVVREEDKPERVRVSFMAPEAILGIVNSDEVTRLGFKIRQRLERVRDSAR